MLSYLWKTNYEVKQENKTRFEQSLVFSNLLAPLNDLRAKQEELKLLADQKGAGSLEFLKHRILLPLTSKLDDLIATFNSMPKPKNTNDDYQDILDLAKGMRTVLEIYGIQHMTRLGIQRNYKRRAASTLLTYSAYSATTIAAFMLPITAIGSLYAAYFASPAVAGLVTKSIGMDPDLTRSLELVLELDKKLGQILLSIPCLIMPLETNKSVAGVPREYVCPITLEIMKEPVVCNLDGSTYEKSAIVTWLTRHRSSPLTRKELTDYQTVNDVIVENRNLKELIQKYESEQRQAVAAEEKTSINLKRK